ncbi:cortactin-binding protein 2-like isoform X2 [Trichogramma pretiosum]|uniref:cortactin-binding protein 2-like isoform X2 n=1 Tax=Trichogramma pretiosum TaxID=7493 RepID=UPI000C718D73|nr:cortactin-binding protein 2-like isoform X2 [Trichogramma pretiosum]
MAQSSTKTTTSNGNGNATTHLHHQQAQQQQQKVRKVLVENRGTGHLVQYNQRSSISSISTVSANSSSSSISSSSSSSSGSSSSGSGSRSNNREKEVVVAGSGATPQQQPQHRTQQQSRTVASVNIRKKHQATQSERANNNRTRRPVNLDLRPAKSSSLPKSASLPSVIPRQGILKFSSADSSSSPQRKQHQPQQQAPTKCRSFSSLLQQLRHPSRKSASSSSLHIREPSAPLIAVRHSSSNESSPVSPYKSVSFSPDTSFASASEARPSQKRKGQQAKLHSCVGYRQGVLADDDRLQCNLPSSWEEALGGPKALLIAAQDADDDVVRRIVNLVGKAGLGDIDVNARDPSGRTAISYMAGNGSALVLEACLGFPGADANLPDNEANTPLHFAAQAGQTECVNILLQRCPSIEVDARNSLGFTPLMKAALQGRTKCAKILLFAGANPTLRDHGRGFRAEQWARFCGRYVCAEVIERFARHRLLEKSSSCRWGSEPELAAQILQGKFMAMPPPPQPVQHHGTGGSLKSKFRRVFRTTSNSERSSGGGGGGHGSGGGFSLVSQLTSAALCASSPVLPKSSDVSPVVKSLLRPLSVPQLRVTLVTQDAAEIDRIDAQLQQQQQQQQSTTVVKPARTKKKNSNNST